MGHRFLSVRFDRLSVLSQDFSSIVDRLASFAFLLPSENVSVTSDISHQIQWMHGTSGISERCDR
jgi:hypothetical protein